jgi:hypothetical protein
MKCVLSDIQGEHPSPSNQVSRVNNKGILSDIRGENLSPSNQMS